MTDPVLDLLADLVSYPSDTFPRRLAEAQTIEGGAIAAGVASLVRWVAARGPGEVEELYTRTFDLDPACALETGWHLYGEDYDRGAFLVRMRGLLREHGVEETVELPDHLGHVLRLLARLEGGAAEALSRRQVLPAVLKVREGLRDEANPYRGVIDAVCQRLESRFGRADAVPASAFAGPAPYEGRVLPCAGMPPRPPQ